ncbi:MAG: YggS family pyridoxal phosphate-dependent enzyme [Myxococcales bacterium FL481]|nr:MAG: YggS family pyridoxal phosphate-dependent enzyme [Myxococcales bacterium FL481]
MNPLAERIDAVLARIDDAVTRRGPGPTVELIAVSKRHEVGAISQAYAHGLRSFGENYAQEFAAKHDQFHAAEVRWHFIGGLQTNKVKLVVGRSLIHTVDRPRLVRAIDKRAAQLGIKQPVLLEVNFGEPQKAGVSPDEAPSLLDEVDQCEHVTCEGLMTIPPVGPPEQTRRHFAALASLRESLRGQHRAIELPELSMGMSADFEVAIEEGATLVRIGTAIFGPRPS